uniref:TOTE conflict system primase domain-containing protein n=1 Tax=Candidatus Kentrum sp. DK TaxID=2126562 RepID=A0A450SZM0_9GAMM|nr:MAG: hypothetical protein BECKDK2373B_GA0170837_108511 [Candidatus Kentron sp. DK]
MGIGNSGPSGFVLGFASSPQPTTAELLAIDARLGEIEEEKQRLLQRKRILQRKKITPTPAPTPANQRSTVQKIALFRALFKGRPDVFARRWENPGKGRSGYAVRMGGGDSVLGRNYDSGSGSGAKA